MDVSACLSFLIGLGGGSGILMKVRAESESGSIFTSCSGLVSSAGRDVSGTRDSPLETLFGVQFRRSYL